MDNKIHSELKDKVVEFFAMHPKGWAQKETGLTKDGNWCVIVTGHYHDDNSIRNKVLFEIEGVSEAPLHETAIKIVQSAIIV